MDMDKPITRTAAFESIVQNKLYLLSGTKERKIGYNKYLRSG